MENKILGLHHITAIADNAQRNFDFYTKVFGLRMVKKTVNFDDPGTYHFYYGNETGTPGTILTFFPWEGIGKGYFWTERFKQFQVPTGEQSERFGETLLPFADPDGLQIALIIPEVRDNRKPWETGDVKANVATKGFHSTTLTLKKIEPTARVLTDILGYRMEKQEKNRFRFITDSVANASIIDLLEMPETPLGRGAAGTNHHIAFRVADENIQMNYREKVLEMGLNITPKIDRDYFYSLYFREPGGVLFEIATDNPGFTVDEPLAELGSGLKLPEQYESRRAAIVKQLPVLT